MRLLARQTGRQTGPILLHRPLTMEVKSNVLQWWVITVMACILIRWRVKGTGTASHSKRKPHLVRITNHHFLIGCRLPKPSFFLNAFNHTAKFPGFVLLATLIYWPIVQTWCPVSIIKAFNSTCVIHSYCPSLLK